MTKITNSGALSPSTQINLSRHSFSSRVERAFTSIFNISLSEIQSVLSVLITILLITDQNLQNDLQQSVSRIFGSYFKQ